MLCFVLVVFLNAGLIGVFVSLAQSFILNRILNSKLRDIF